MPQTFSTPQEAEDAYYDALEQCDIDRLLAIWADSDDIYCLFPMYPMIQGREGIRDVFSHLLHEGHGLELMIEHLDWIETQDIAIHLVEETIQNPPPGAPPAAPVYGTNIFRQEAGGWRLIVHQNAPTPPPPPPELMMPE